MRQVRIQGTITTGRWTLPVVIIICTVCWCVSNALTFDNGLSMTYVPFGLTARQVEIVPEWCLRLAGYAAFAAIGYFLIGLNNVFAIVRTRASAQTSFFFLLVTACPLLHTGYAGIIVAMSLALSLFLLFSGYHTYGDAPQYVFGSFALLSVATLFSPKIIYLAPIWLIGAVQFRAMSPRSLCAALVGLILPYWFLFGHAFYHDRMELFTMPFTEMVTFSDIGLSVMPLYGISTLSYMFLLFAASLLQYLMESYKDKMQIRSYLIFLFNLTAYCYLFVLLQPSMLNDLLVTMMMSVSVLAAHLFVLTSSKASNIFFIIITVGLVLLYALNLLTAI